MVWTETERLKRHRRNIVELYLSEVPDGAEPPEALSKLAGTLGLTEVRYRAAARRKTYRDDSNPFFTFKNDLCVSCALCPLRPGRHRERSTRAGILTRDVRLGRRLAPNIP